MPSTFNSSNDGIANTMSQDSTMNASNHQRGSSTVPDAATSSSPSSSSSPKKASPSSIIFGKHSSSTDVKNIASLGLSSDSNSNTPASSSQNENVQVQSSMSSDAQNHSSSTSSANPITAVDSSNQMQTDPNTSTTAVLNPTINGPPVDPVSKDQVRLLPPNFGDAEPDDIAVLVADMLTRLISHNDQLPLHPSSLTRFHSRATPGITIASYLRRIAKYTSLDKACTLILLVYIDRVCERLEGFTICGLTVHRFTCAAVVCASKALCDAFSTNGHYARVGGISLVELNMLEKEFLSIIDWRLTCSGALLQHYYISLVKSHPAYALSETATVPAPSLAGMSLDIEASAPSENNSSSRSTINPAISNSTSTSTPHSPSDPISSKSNLTTNPGASNNTKTTPRTRSRSRSQSRSRSTSKQRKSSRRRTEDFDSGHIGEDHRRRMDEDQEGDGNGDWNDNQRDVEMFEGDRESRARNVTNEIQSGVG